MEDKHGGQAWSIGISDHRFAWKGFETQKGMFLELQVTQKGRSSNECHLLSVNELICSLFINYIQLF
jgi:hypothetical protein